MGKVVSIKGKQKKPPQPPWVVLGFDSERDMLLSGEALSSAAYLCGFSDQSHLTRTFKKIYGVTPGVYAAAASAR